MRVLFLLTDAFGGRGGIAQVNRDVVSALSAMPDLTEVVVLPRLQPDAPGAIPPRITVREDAVGGKARFAYALIRLLASDRRFDVVLCGHLHLLPLAWPAARLAKAPLVLIVHGIDAWEAPNRPVARRLAGSVDACVAVSTFTFDRFLTWSGLSAERCRVIPNAVDLQRFTPGSKRADLLDRYRLQGKKVILTLSRLPSRERFKGHDEIMGVLGDLARDVPNVAYLIAGDGPDRPRLERLALELGVADRVVFSGYVPEEEKVDHFRLADVFAMPGRGEGFGIVYLEALACGAPVIVSTADASHELARPGLPVTVVDPADPAALHGALLHSLNTKRYISDVDRLTREALAYYSTAWFERRWQQVITCADFHRDGGSKDGFASRHLDSNAGESTSPTPLVSRPKFT